AVPLVGCLGASHVLREGDVSTTLRRLGHSVSTRRITRGIVVNLSGGSLRDDAHPPIRFIHIPVAGAPRSSGAASACGKWSQPSAITTTTPSKRRHIWRFLRV